MKDNWIIKEINNNDVRKISEDLNFSVFMASLLSSRGLKNTDEIRDYCHPRLSLLNSPFMMKNMHEAVDRVRRAILKKEKIGIFADSDLDGMTSLTILNNILLKFGLQVYYRYIKNEENYGLTRNMIDEFHSEKIDLLITVDSGVRDSDEISYARSLGIEIIITDHHEPDQNLPDAIIINPKQEGCTYPFKHLAGVGVVFKLCQAILFSYLPVFNKYYLILDVDDEGVSYSSLIKNGIIENRSQHNRKEDLSVYLDSIKPEYTILHNVNQDIESYLTNELHSKTIYNFFDFAEQILNISFVDKKNALYELCNYFSLQDIIQKKRITLLEIIFLEIQLSSSPKIFDFLKSNIFFVAIGTVADVMPLANENRILVKEGVKFFSETKHPGLMSIASENKVDSKFISWDIAPLLNTPGRFGKTYLTERFFLTNDKSELAEIIKEIRSLNDERKEMVNALYGEITGEINQGLINADDKMIFVRSDKIPEGLAGLLAHRISETNGKPVIVATMTGHNKYVKGSGRCSHDLDFFSYVEPHAAMFDRIGGHAQAFGFTVHHDLLDSVVKKINSSMSSCVIDRSYINIDLAIDIKDINARLVEDLSILEPFGKDNEEPLFLSRNVIILEFTRFGNNSNHGKYRFSDNLKIEAIGWNIGEIMEDYFNSGNPIDIVFTLDIKKFNRMKFVQLKIIDLCNSF